MRTVKLAVGAALVGAGFLAGALFGWKQPSQGPTSARQALYWICPMHPAYKSDRPGVAPCCGMQVEPVFGDESGHPMIAGAVRVGDVARQLIGVRTGTVERSAAERTLRSVGRVVADENRQFRVVAPGEGIVRSLSARSATGGLVRENEVLLTYFARDFVRPQQIYFAALDYLDAAVKGNAAADRLAQVRGQVRIAIDELINFGMTESQIVELGTHRRIVSDIEMRAPGRGLVMSRGVSPGERFERGAELFRIADLSRVWILVDLFEADARELRPGTKVPVRLPHARERVIAATVSDAVPQFDPESRTLKVRLEVENPGYELRPGMFVDAEVPVPRREGLTVPLEAVIDSGLRKTVYVDHGDGTFEPRMVETGWRAGDRVEIVHGLAEDEKIVVSGGFLLDSESRMKRAAEGIANPARDLVCGMDVDETKARSAGLSAVHDGKTYFFCAPGCKTTFLADPGKYLVPGPVRQDAADTSPRTGVSPARLALAPAPAADLHRVLGSNGMDDATRTPVTNVPVQMQLGQYSSLAESATATLVMDAACGTVLPRAEAEKTGLSSVHEGVTYYFASKRCKDLFDASPQRYALAAADYDRTVSSAYSASHARDAAVQEGHATEDGSGDDHASAAAHAATDLVCGMAVDANEATVGGLVTRVGAKTYYFCSKQCKTRFDAEPVKYGVAVRKASR